MINNFIKNLAIFTGISLSIFLLSFIVLAWDGPQTTPPAGNTPKPLNLGTVGTSQRVEGGFNVGGVLVGDTGIIPNASTATRPTCNSSTEGMQWYNYSTKNLDLCDGANWLTVAGDLGHTFVAEEATSSCYNKTNSSSGSVFMYTGGSVWNGCRSTATLLPIPTDEVFKINYKYYKPSGYDSNLRYAVGVRLVTAPDCVYNTGSSGLGYHQPQCDNYIVGAGQVNNSTWNDVEIVVDVPNSRYKNNGEELTFGFWRRGSSGIVGSDKSAEALTYDNFYVEVFGYDYGSYANYVSDVVITRNATW